MATFGERLRFLRKQRDVTQEELAARAGVGKQAISQYERGVRTPDYETLGAISDFFNVSTDYMIGKSDVTIRLLDTDDLAKLNNNHHRRIPVLGRVAAGIPIEMVEDVIDWEEIDDATAKLGAIFALSIKGDSMEPRIVSGDVVIVRQQDDAESGDIVIVSVNGDDATCKRLRKYKDGIELVPSNPSYSPIFFSNDEIIAKPVKILGKVIELRGKF